MKRLILLISLSSQLAGCAGTAFISAQLAPGQKIKRPATFIFPVPDHTSIDDRKLIHLVSEEFERQGLSVIKDPKGKFVDYLVAVSGTQSSSQITGSYPQTETQTTTVNNAWGLPVASAKTQSTTYVPYSYDYRVQKIYVTVYSLEDYFENKRLLSVWEGYLGQGANKFSKHSRCAVKELVTRLGLDYERHTRIDSYCDAATRKSDE